MANKQSVITLDIIRGFFFLIMCFLISACPDDEIETPDRNTTIILQHDHTGIFFVKLNVSVIDSTENWTFSLSRNDSIVRTIVSDRPDTTIQDPGLQPLHTYRYKAYWMDGATRRDSSDEIVVTTMDTTSHNVHWEIDTLGVFPSYLYGMEVVDENNIWVVGSITTNEYDSSAQTDYTRYNAAHWDGSEWNPLKILSGHTPNYDIIYINENDIWVTSGTPIHWDGSEWTLYHLWNMGVLSQSDSGVRYMWKTIDNEIYFIGDNGIIVHYNGSGFQKVYTSTSADLLDVWGIYNPEANQEILYTGGLKQPNETVILKNSDGDWVEWFYNPYSDYINFNPNVVSGPIVSVWTEDPDFLYTVTYWGLYSIKESRVNDFQRIPDVNAWGGYINKLRGTGSNDIFFAGDAGAVWHYNGFTLHKYEDLTGNRVLRDIEIEGENIYMCGQDYQSHQAIVIRGIRN